MEINIKASLTSAFLTGVAIFIPVYISKNYESFGDAGNYLISFVFVAYISAMFLFVLGATYWDTYRFIPKDGIYTSFKRGLMWLLGGVSSLMLLEVLNAI